jgi:hypothetical protein
MTVYARAEGHFAETRIDDEVVLMNIDSGAFHAVRGPAMAIWDAIDGHQSTRDIVTQLTARFDVGTEQCTAEVDSFMASMAKAGFVRAA